MSRVWAVVGGLVVLVAVLALGGWLLLNHLLEQRLLASLGNAAKADVHCGSLSLNPLAGRLEMQDVTFRSRNATSIWQQAHTGRVTASFPIAQLFAAEVPVKLEIDQARLSFLPPADFPPQESAPASGPGSDASTAPDQAAPRWPHLVVREVAIHHLDLDTGGGDSTLAAHDLTVLAEHPVEDAWQGSVSGAITVHGVEFAAMAADFSSDAHGIDIPRFTLTDPASGGSIAGHAHLPETATEPATLHFDLHRMPLNLLIPARWQMILTGKANGGGDYTGSLADWRAGTAQLHVALDEPRLETLPFIHGLGGIPGLGALSGLSLDVASADVAYDHGAFALTNVNLTRQGTLTLLGQATVSSDGTLNGTFQFGLPPSALALAPVLQQQIFNAQHDGYDWTQVKLSGGPGQWTEDLSPRVANAMPAQAAQWLQQGQSVLNKDVKKASDFLNNLLK
jgi:hypothetical protein